MKEQIEIDNVLAEICKMNINLIDIKKMSEEDIKNTSGLKETIVKIKDFYISEIINKIPEEKMIKLKDNSLHRKYERFENILIGFGSTCALGVGGGFFLWLGGLFFTKADPYLMFFALTVMLSFLLAIVSGFMIENNHNKMLSNIEKTILNTGRPFESIIREITIDLIEDIKNKGTHSDQVKNNLIEYLVEENYLSEKKKSPNVFDEIKKEILIKIETYNSNKLTDKRILEKEKITFEGKLNFLVTKNNEEKIES